MSLRTKTRRHPATVWLVEDNPLAVRYLRENLHRIRIVWSGSYEDAVRCDPAKRDSPAIVVIDRGLALISDAGFLQLLRSLFRENRILIIGRATADEDVCRLLFSGARGFVDYDDVPKHLERAVEALSRGRLWIKREVLEKLPLFAANSHKQQKPTIEVLTRREIAVLNLLQRRLSNKEIASELGTSERTAKFHLQNVFRKLGVHDRYSATDLAKEVLDPGQATEGHFPFLRTQYILAANATSKF